MAGNSSIAGSLDATEKDFGLLKDAMTALPIAGVSAKRARLPSALFVMLFAKPKESGRHDLQLSQYGRVLALLAGRVGGDAPRGREDRGAAEAESST